MNSEELQRAHGPHLHWEAPELTEQEAFNLDEHVKELMAKADEADAAIAREQVFNAGDFLDYLAKEIHPVNVEKGFWKEPEMMDKYAAKMMLVVTETAEVVEALRKSQGKDKVTEEFSDILIRMLDLYITLVEAGEADPNLLKVTMEKMETNKNRPPKHGNRWG